MRGPTKITGTPRAGVQEHEIGVSVVSIERDDRAVVADSFSKRPAPTPDNPVLWKARAALMQAFSRELSQQTLSPIRHT